MSDNRSCHRRSHSTAAVLVPFLLLAVLFAVTGERPVAQSGNNAARANSYDDAWQDGPTGWVANAKSILAGGDPDQVTGLVLWIGDSLTRDPALGAWAQRGLGKTAEDQMITNWMHAGLSPQSIDSIDGFTLATPYICSQRSYTVGDGLGSWHFMGNGMPADTNPTTARQKLQDCATYPNMLNLTTMLAALPKAQFAIPEVNLDAAQPDKFPDFERMVDLMIAHHIVPIIITYTYRQDAQFNSLVDRYNTALVQYAQSKKLPLIDFNNEMLARLPFSQWMGRFLGDGVHYTHGNAQYPSTSDPYADGGDPATHTTGMALTFDGYGLKGWLGVQKMKEIKQLVIDAAPPPPAPAQITSPAPRSTLTSSTQTFGWSTGTGVSSYRLDVGNTAGATDFYAGAPTTNLSAQVTGLPTDGRTIWARLSSNIGGTWQTRDESYIAASPAPPAPGVISVNFVGGGVSMSAAESAGVVPATNWNNATGATRTTPLPLNDGTGAATGAAITWRSDNVWSMPIVDQAGNRRLMKGYLDNGNEGTTTVTVSGLPASTYDVYVYADGDNGSATRTGGYQISGAGITTTTINLTDAANTNFNATFTQASNSTGNYVRFSGLTPGAGGFTLTATPGAASVGAKRAPVNAIQIVSTASPPPDFTIAATPGSRTVTQGSGTSYTINVGSVNGFSGTVSLTASGLPANATASFTPSSVTGAASATLNVSTAASTPAGNSTLAITGTSGSLSRSSTVTLVVSAAVARRAISINFIGTGTSMGATESAGVVAAANWNNAPGAARSTPLALKDETGAATAAAVTWTSDNAWSTPITDQAGNRRFMKGYLDNGLEHATVVTVTGLPAGSYNVYVYADGDNAANSRTGGYRISGAGITTTTINMTDAASTNFNGTFTQASNSTGNYVRFTGITPGSGGFTLTATPGLASAGPRRAPVNGIQIVPVP
jgi:hypothetical protein